MTDNIPIDEAVAEEFAGDMNQVSSPRTPITPRDGFSILAWTLLADLLIFRTLGFSGPALFFALAPLLFLIGSHGRSRMKSIVGIIILLLILAVRMAWLGNALNIASGVALIVALAMACTGHAPFVLEGVAFGLRAILDGVLVLCGQKQAPYLASIAPAISTTSDGSVAAPSDLSAASDLAATPSSRTRFSNLSAALLMPLVAAVVFGMIFVFANPDLVGWFSQKASDVWDIAWGWISGISIFEIPFCIAALFFGAGLLRPFLSMPTFGPKHSIVHTPGTTKADLFAAHRNTLITLIVLFGVYLAFEFITLWRREFPQGFYYAGYAHQGAAWLTFALALATGLLSFVFSGKVLDDPRLDSLRKLTWIWSAQNFLLAIAVYNRLMIYVGYNGMTRMRTIGFFGITLVVVGFALVLWKIAKNRGFWWLVRGQLIALVLTVMAYGLFPVDWVAHRYNASQVASGYLHPSVMIAVKPIDDEGISPLLGLTNVDDPIIREGVLALLAERQNKIRLKSEEHDWHWTRFQASTHWLYPRLEANQEQWSKYTRDFKARRAAISSFQDYAMQWY